MSEEETKAKPVYFRITVQVSESEYFSYKAKEGEAEINLTVLESQLDTLDLTVLSQVLLPIATLKYRTCVPETDDD